MKKMFSLGGITILFLGVLVLSGCDLKKDTVTEKETGETEVEEVTEEEVENIVNDGVGFDDERLGQIIDLFAYKYGKDQSELSVDVSLDEGDYLMGNVSTGEGLENQGMYLAVSYGGQWELVWDGNGTPYCSQLEEHDFPESMMVGCDDGPEHVDEPNPVHTLVGGLQALSSIQFNDLYPEAEFDWVHNGEFINLKGYKIVAAGIPGGHPDTTVITNYLENKGFEFDMMNIADGTIVGSVGYKKDNIVCKIRSGMDPETEVGEIWVMCGYLLEGPVSAAK